MAKSKQYSEILRLGELLVKELGLQQSVDTLGRWMAHHVSELMVEAEGSERQEVEDRCRDAILALWRHIDVFQNNHKPLEETGALFATIRALDPDNTAHFYYSQALEKIEQSGQTEESKRWLELSQGIDNSARLLIGVCLKEAVKDIKNDNEEWLKLAKNLDIDIPQTVVIRAFSDEPELSEQEAKEKRIKNTIKDLMNRKDRLAMLVNLAGLLDEKIDEDIQTLQNG